MTDRRTHLSPLPSPPWPGVEQGSVEDQLGVLYADRQLLHRELGVSSAREVIALVRSMEAQLIDLYQARAESEREQS